MNTMPPYQPYTKIKVHLTDTTACDCVTVKWEQKININ